MLIHLYTILYVDNHSILFLQPKGTKRTATTAGPLPAAVAGRGKGGAETGIDAAGTAVATVRIAGTDAG